MAAIFGFEGAAGVAAAASVDAHLRDTAYWHVTGRRAEDWAEKANRLAAR